MRTVVGVVAAGIICCVTAVGAEEPGLSKPIHVQVQVQFVEIAKTDADALQQADAGGIPSKDSILNLMKQEKAKVLCSPSLTTLSGQEATVKAVEEYIYPTSLVVEPLHAPQTNAVASGASDLIAVSPANFTTREVGTILSCCPTVEEDGTINVFLALSFVERPTWKTYKTTCFMSDGREKDVDFEQPFFYCLDLSTTLLIKNGETVVAGGGMQDSTGEAYTSILVTARLLDASGNPQSRK